MGALGGKEPTSTEEMVYEWKYKGGGGVNHPPWWKVWCCTAVAIFLYENTYDFATRPCQVDVKIFGKASSSEVESQECYRARLADCPYTCTDRGKALSFASPLSSRFLPSCTPGAQGVETRAGN